MEDSESPSALGPSHHAGLDVASLPGLLEEGGVVRLAFLSGAPCAAQRRSCGQGLVPQGLEFCQLDSAGKSLLRAAITQLGMSARAFHRILKLSRTIADSEGSADIQTQHLAEAIQYRPRRQM